jgi:hypothetical protein
MQNWTISPSDLTFLWDECPRCFYLKYRQDFRRPASAFPKIFGTIDLLMKDIYLDQSTRKMSPDLPEGKAIMSGRWVTSEPIGHTDIGSTAALRGIFDTLVQFEDGNYGVIDFKTTRANESHVAFYSRQLHAYAYALEHPAPGALRCSPISRMGLLCFDPNGMEESPPARLSLHGPATWLEIPLDMPAFLEFMGAVLALLDSPEPPPPDEKCGFCAYREAARNTGF